MTGNNDKLRSLFLAALMVMSVVAMTTAFTGGAAAAALNEEPEVQSAVEIDDEIQLAFNTNVQANDTDSLGTENITVTVNGDDYTPDNVDDPADGDRYSIDGPWGSLEPVDDVSLEIDTIQTQGADANYSEIGEVDVDVTSQMISANDADYDARDEGATVYVGETLALEAANEGETIRLKEYEGEYVLNNGSPADNATILARNTEGLDSGQQYRVEFPDNGDSPKYINMTSLDLEATAQTNEYWDDQDFEVDVSSAAGNRGVQGELLDDNGDTVDTAGVQLDGNAEGTLNFGETDDAGNYTVEVTDNQSGVTAETDTVEVSARGDSDISFADGNVISEQTGDIADIPLDFSNTDEGTVVIGNNESVNYYVTANVTAPSENSEVNLRFNTFTAGIENESTDALFDGEEVLWTDTEDAEVDVQAQRGEFVENNTGEGNNDVNKHSLLEASSDYSINASIGHNAEGSDAWMDPSDVGTLNLQESSAENMTANVAPRDQLHDDVGPIWAGIGSNVTENDEVAHNDVAVLQLDESGLEGEIETNYDNATDYFLDQEAFDIEHTNADTNAGDRPMAIEFSDTTVASDFDNDTHFVQIDTDEVNTAAERQYNASGFSSAYTNFTVVEPEAELDTEQIDEEPWVTASPEDNQSFAGETNVAPGSEVTAYLQSLDSESPFLITPTATVQADGTYEATTDEFADRAVGIEFDASTRMDNDVLGEVQDGVIQEPSTPTPEPGTETPTAMPGTDTPTSTPTSEPGTDEPDDTPTPTTSGDGPGFGIAVSLIALIGAALLAARRYE